MKQIKVVHVANYDLGLKVHLGNYMSYLQEQGYAVSAITNPGRWLTSDTKILNEISVKIMQFKPSITPMTDFKTLRDLYNYFRSENFDIVHTHTVKAGLLGRLAAKLAGTPAIVHTVHGYYFYEGMHPLQYRLFVMLEKLGALCSDLILSQNQQDIDTSLRERICPPEKIQHLGNGIDLQRFDPLRIDPGKISALRSQLGITEGQVIAGFIARWERDKGVFEFLEAARILKMKGLDIRYIMTGAPPIEKSSSVSPRELISLNRLENEVILLGYREDIPELIALADMIVLPSHGREGIPRILMESAAMGKPVVATKVRGVVEAVTHGETGLLTPVQDPQALADAILSLAKDRQSAHEMGQRAHQRAITQFDERQFFYKTDQAYRKLIRDHLGKEVTSRLRPLPDAYLE